MVLKKLLEPNWGRGFSDGGYFRISNFNVRESEIVLVTGSPFCRDTRFVNYPILELRLQ